ncbi:MAG: glycosyl transferase group [Prolixibacteraceae bacterium]|nr:MAG: glycosyl transferase group [Prolixibacteraceae bacterium]
MENITIIEPCNFVDYPTGGQLAFVKNLLQSFNGELILVGVSTDNDKIGVWAEKEIGGRKYKFFPFISGKREKNKPIIPMRLRVYLNLKRHRKKILNGCGKIIVIQAPEVLLALRNRLTDKEICFLFPGIENPLKFSRYFYARVFTKIYDRLFLSVVTSAKWILAAADSNAISELQIRGKGLKNRNIIQFPTRIDESIFQKNTEINFRKIFNIPDNKIVVVTCGRLGYYKGWELMIDAFKLFLVKYPNAFFYFIGDGEDQHKITRYIQSNNLDENVKLAGFLMNTEIARYLNLADIFVMGSFKEGWSTTLLEASCVGVPSVVTNFSSAKDIVKNGINGYVVESRDPKEFSEKMVRALQIDRNLLPESRMERFKIKTLKKDLLEIFLKD